MENETEQQMRNFNELHIVEDQSRTTHERTIPGLCRVIAGILTNQTNHRYKSILVKFSDIDESRLYWKQKDMFEVKLDPTKKDCLIVKNFLLTYQCTPIYHEEQGYNFILEYYQSDCLKLLCDLRGQLPTLAIVIRQILVCLKNVIQLVNKDGYCYNLTSFKAIKLNDGYIIKFDWTDPMFTFGNKQTAENILKQQKNNLEKSTTNFQIKRFLKEIQSIFRILPVISVSSEKESFDYELQSREKKPNNENQHKKNIKIKIAKNALGSSTNINSEPYESIMAQIMNLIETDNCNLDTLRNFDNEISTKKLLNIYKTDNIRRVISRRNERRDLYGTGAVTGTGTGA